MTTVSETHIEKLESLEGVLEEKLDLLRGLPGDGKALVGDEPAIQIHARYYVTNIAAEKMLVVGCKLKPEGTDQTYDLRHSVRQMSDGEEKTPTILVSVDGFIHPPITRDGDTLEAQVNFVDQFGNEISGPVTTFTQK